MWYIVRRGWFILTGQNYYFATILFLTSDTITIQTQQRRVHRYKAGSTKPIKPPVPQPPKRSTVKESEILHGKRPDYHYEMSPNYTLKTVSETVTNLHIVPLGVVLLL